LTTLRTERSASILDGGTISIGKKHSFPKALQISSALVEQIEAHLRASLPCEGCGMLAVRPATNDIAAAARFYPGTNVDASPSRYTMDLAEVVAAFRDIDEHDWTLGAIVHSHPATPATPSPTDLREAYYPEALMLIVSFAGGGTSMRAWAITFSGDDRIPLEIPIDLSSQT
jgi:proteasome lid subunit RPN8/RPN11